MGLRSSAGGGVRMGGGVWFGVEGGAVRLLGGWFLGEWLMGEVELGSWEPFMQGSTENRAL